MTESKLAKAALAYASYSCHVFPCAPNSKMPLTEHGFHDASIDSQQIDEWWEKWPQANIAMWCKKSDYIALDIDRAKMADESHALLKDLMENYPTAVQSTPTNGTHLLYMLPGDIELSNSSGTLPPGFDVRVNGYIMLAPSVVTYRGADAKAKGVEDGHTGSYAWLPERKPTEFPPQPLPDHIIAMLTAKQRPPDLPTHTQPLPPTQKSGNDRYAQVALERELDTLARTQEGARNEQLNKSAFSIGQLVAGGALDEHDTVDKLATVALAIGLEERETARTIQSAFTAAVQSARTVPQTPQLIFRNGNGRKEDAPSVSVVNEYHTMPPLPESASIDTDVARGAASWLDDYTEHSRIWSPRAHDDFHEATGLWILSTVAARRIRVDLGGERYTNLAIALAARTSIFAKTTTAKIGMDLLRDANLSYLLAPDDATPQAFIRNMVARLPATWAETSREKQLQIEERLAFAGQKGWYFDEFGQKVSAMMREGGFMADFRGLLRKFDDTPAIYEYVSVGRGSDTVTRPYLALLANLTPADLVPFAKRGAALWGDGFFARFSFITPGPDSPRKKGKFPDGTRVSPASLVNRLVQWHARLGVPDVQVATLFDANDKEIGKYDLSIVPAPVRQCILGDGVFDAFYRYHDALLDIVEKSTNHDLDGNYSRMAEKALRIAMLLGSIENHDRIEIRHWARAQQITESWRQNLHNLYNEVTGGGQSRGEEIEERIMKLIADKGPLTKREIYTFIRGLDSGTAGVILQNMLSAELITLEKEGKSERYHLAG